MVGSQGDVGSCLVVAHIGTDARGWLASLHSIERVETSRIVVAAAPECVLPDAIVPDLRVGSLAELLALLVEQHDPRWIAVIGEPSLVPSACFETLGQFCDDRFATVSYLSNSAGPLSFPFAGTPVPWTIAGRTAESLTAMLRRDTASRPFVPVPVAAGPVVAFAATAIRMLPPGWDRDTVGWQEAVAAFSLASQARGLLNVVDRSTFVHRPGDLRPLEVLDVAGTERLQRRFPWVDTSIAVAVTDEASPFRLEHRLARAQVEGLRILVDGSCLGPYEMGTQLGVVQICRALAAREDVAKVAVTLHGTLPSYARELAEEPKVSFVRSLGDSRLDTEEHFDVAFRAFQPDVDFDLSMFRRYASRAIVSILDLIAYQNGSYFASGDGWIRYRSAICETLGRVDGVTTISHDVREMVRMERLPVPDDRLFAVPYGTGHLESEVTKRMPDAFASDPAGRFLVCLGTNYAHKNRDLALRVLRLLRQRGHDLRLVLAGPSVPYGSSRLHEAEVLHDMERSSVLALADVPTAERNWLLSHAEVVLYPTSAEGFGLVPYEAAWLDTPTAFVPFGPLTEIAGDLPVVATDWSPCAFAAAVESLLLDPALGRHQVEVLRGASQRWSWGSTAAQLMSTFLSVLARRPVS